MTRKDSSKPCVACGDPSETMQTFPVCSMPCGHDVETMRAPLPMLLWCPQCHQRHVDAGRFETRVHHTHACQHCGHVWRPAIVATVGVQFLPGFKDVE